MFIKKHYVFYPHKNYVVQNSCVYVARSLKIDNFIYLLLFLVLLLEADVI